MNGVLPSDDEVADAVRFACQAMWNSDGLALKTV